MSACVNELTDDAPFTVFNIKLGIRRSMEHMKHFKVIACISADHDALSAGLNPAVYVQPVNGGRLTVAIYPLHGVQTLEG